MTLPRPNWNGQSHFVTPGVQPRMTPSQGVVFLAYRDYRQHPFLAIYRNGSWSGRDLTRAPGPSWSWP